MDFRKAFDTQLIENTGQIEREVWHVWWVPPFGKIHVQRGIKLNDQMTDWYPINNGVKQGCLLSPTLFSLYIEDLDDELNSTSEGIDINSSCTSLCR